MACGGCLEEVWPGVWFVLDTGLGCGPWRVPGRGVAWGVVCVGHWARVWPVEGAWKRCGLGCGLCGRWTSL